MKDHVHNAMCGIGPDLGFDSGLKIAILLKELDQRSLRILNIYGRVGAARGIIRDLQQTGIREPANRSGKFENSKVNGGLKNKQDSNPTCLRTNLQLYFFSLSTILESRDCLIDLCLGKRLSLALCEKWPDLLFVDIRPAGQFEGEDTLPFIRR